MYHPQTDGLVECLNKTLKCMSHNFLHKDGCNWDRWLDPLLFAVLEASSVFCPFELLFGRTQQGALDLVMESWEEGPSPS